MFILFGAVWYFSTEIPRPTLNVQGASVSVSRATAATAAPIQRGRTKELSSDAINTTRQPTTPPAGAFLILSQVGRLCVQILNDNWLELVHLISRLH